MNKSKFQQPPNRIAKTKLVPDITKLLGKSLSSTLESFREYKVPGTSSETTFDNFFTEAPNLPKACARNKQQLLEH